MSWRDIKYRIEGHLETVFGGKRTGGCMIVEHGDKPRPHAKLSYGFYDCFEVLFECQDKALDSYIIASIYNYKCYFHLGRCNMTDDSSLLAYLEKVKKNLELRLPDKFLEAQPWLEE